MKEIPKYLAIHEAGHAVASHLMQKRLGRDWPQFERIVLRTREEIKAGPFIDLRGREHDHIQGIVEGGDRYIAIGRNGVIANCNVTPPELLAQLRKNMEADVIQLMSGPAAEARYRRWPGAGPDFYFAVFLREVTFTDFEEAHRKIQDFCSTDDETGELFNALLEQSIRLVARNWPAITTLASELLQVRSMEADEAVRIIESAQEVKGERDSQAVHHGR
jgi:hypothetical protein